MVYSNILGIFIIRGWGGFIIRGEGINCAWLVGWLGGVLGVGGLESQGSGFKVTSLRNLADTSLQLGLSWSVSPRYHNLQLARYWLPQLQVLP